MIDGREAIILDIYEANKLLEAIKVGWSKERIEELNKKNLLDIVNKFSLMVRRFDE
jgi:hypothetical protein